MPRDLKTMPAGELVQFLKLNPDEYQFPVGKSAYDVIKESGEDPTSYDIPDAPLPFATPVSHNLGAPGFLESLVGPSTNDAGPVRRQVEAGLGLEPSYNAEYEKGSYLPDSTAGYATRYADNLAGGVAGALGKIVSLPGRVSYLLAAPEVSKKLGRAGEAQRGSQAYLDEVVGLGALTGLTPPGMTLGALDQVRQSAGPAETAEGLTNFAVGLGGARAAIAKGAGSLRAAGGDIPYQGIYEKPILPEGVTQNPLGFLSEKLNPESYFRGLVEPTAPKKSAFTLENAEPVFLDEEPKLLPPAQQVIQVPREGFPATPGYRKPTQAARIATAEQSVPAMEEYYRTNPQVNRPGSGRPRGASPLDDRLNRIEYPGTENLERRIPADIQPPVKAPPVPRLSPDEQLKADIQFLDEGGDSAPQPTAVDTQQPSASPGRNEISIKEIFRPAEPEAAPAPKPTTYDDALATAPKLVKSIEGALRGKHSGTPASVESIARVVESQYPLFRGRGLEIVQSIADRMKSGKRGAKATLNDPGIRPFQKGPAKTGPADKLRKKVKRASSETPLPDWMNWVDEQKIPY